MRSEVGEALESFKHAFFVPSRNRREQMLQRMGMGELSEDELPRDILTVLLANRQEQNLDDDMILREVAFFMQAGSHSSANALTHTFHELHQWCLSHPEDRE